MIATLFHVTAKRNLDGICANGLRPAAALGATEAHRDGWTQTPIALLRRQNMRDEALSTRLAPGITPHEWRGFINGHVFLFTDIAAAERLRCSPRDVSIPQILLRINAAALHGAGAALLGCRFNNGYLCRAAIGQRRLRDFIDYGPWQGEKAREVAVRGDIPASLIQW